MASLIKSARRGLLVCFLHFLLGLKGRHRILVLSPRSEGHRLPGVENVRKHHGGLAIKSPVRPGCGQCGNHKWRHNALRHSFCSYWLAVTKNSATTAHEAGNSPAMIHRHYHALSTEADGKRGSTSSRSGWPTSSPWPPDRPGGVGRPGLHPRLHRQRPGRGCSDRRRLIFFPAEAGLVIMENRVRTDTVSTCKGGY